ncbi:MAG: 50S ribosomal protein L3 N(5)-glutamine methyltransferase [Burkholderiaceae bacterium]|jgi:ribosomal protein L3 glutamine methyltransferase|nr:50S ribosomal protein L3 N(5)-glutamine methyltransferase [Burkholderiaceae bacterium]MEB2350722.1 50S ribosomal protein L3 N(5)-glutamine methyltransferase [Burkholderiaceae bacterium]
MSPAFERRLADAPAAARELRTLRDLLRWAISRFERAGIAYGHGTDNAHDEAAALLLWALHLPPEPLDPWLDARLTLGERRAVVELVERRIALRAPAAYLTGEAWLRGMRFACDARALVPRSPIAEALDEALPQWLELHPRAPSWPAAILDLCTGGGSLAILAADRFPDAQVVGADLSAEALALAEINRDDHALQQRVELLCGDLFAPLRSRRFDLVLCNPPYVNETSMQALPPEFRAEPRAALAGGRDGMAIVRRIIGDAPRHLADDGLLLLEIGHEAAHFEAAFPALEFHYLPVAAGERTLVLVEAGQLAAAAARRRARSATTARKPRARARQRP